MKITSKKLMEQVKKRSYFATMRNYHYNVGSIIQLTDGANEIGRAVVMGVFLNTPAFRKALVKYSGYDTIEDWVKDSEQVYSSGSGKPPRYIILCKVIELDVDVAELIEMTEDEKDEESEDDDI